MSRMGDLLVTSDSTGSYAIPNQIRDNSNQVMLHQHSSNLNFTLFHSRRLSIGDANQRYVSNSYVAQASDASCLY